MAIRRFALVLSLTGLVLTFGHIGAAGASVRKGDRAAEFVNLKSGSGKRVKLKQFRGRIVVLTFGASWCAPCAKELPAYEKLSKKYSKKDVIFVAVNIDNSVGKGKVFVKKSGLKNVLAVYDPKKSSVDSYDPPTMPSTFIIDRKGIVRAVHAGFRSGDDKLVGKLIEKYK